VLSEEKQEEAGGKKETKIQTKGKEAIGGM
jgi:hypothetical protein